MFDVAFGSYWKIADGMFVNYFTAFWVHLWPLKYSMYTSFKTLGTFSIKVGLNFIHLKIIIENSNYLKASHATLSHFLT